MKMMCMIVYYFYDHESSRKANAPCYNESAFQTQIRNNMGLRIPGDNLVRWRFENVEINYLNLIVSYWHSGILNHAIFAKTTEKLK